MIPGGGQLLTFGFQYGVAVQVDEVTVVAGTIAGEFDLQLHFAMSNGFGANRAFDPGAPTAPYLIRYRVGQFPALDDFAGFAAQKALVAHPGKTSTRDFWIGAGAN